MVAFSDAEALVAHPGVTAVYVASPPGSHTELAAVALKHRKPTYIEKPLARDPAESRRIVEAFETAGVPLFVAYYRRVRGAPAAAAAAPRG